MSTLNIVLWGVQVFLALFFLGAGAPKIFGRGIDRWAGFSDLPRPLVVFIGLTEVLGAATLVVPMAVGTLQWATPLAAIGLGVTVLMAAGFHVRADERLPALETVLWASLTAVVAIGRWELIGPIEMPPMILIGAVVMLVPALVVNFIAILRSPLGRA
jgi:hypothetical protein